MIRYGISFTMALAMMAGCGASQTTGGSSGSDGSGSGYVECGGIQCGKPATCVAVVGMSPEQSKQECVLKCHEDTDCPKGQACQIVHDVGHICQMAAAE
jgi:hypothetical protein|nr:hypothetical protein [Kofleriaceae bacterium]